MKLLALDTSSDNCSCALNTGGEVLSRCERIPRRHAERLLPMVQALLAEAGMGLRDLDGLAFGRGPGSFTGLRIAAGVVQGLGRGAGLPVVPVSSLRALAQGAYRRQARERVLAAFDARMGEVYAGAFQLGDGRLMAPVGEESVSAPSALARPSGKQWSGAGSGWQAHGDSLRERLGFVADAEATALQPEALDVLQLAQADWANDEAVDASAAIPVYLRNRVADTKRERLERGRGRKP